MADGLKHPKDPEPPEVVEGASVAAAVAEAHRREWAYVLAATVRLTRNLDTAEECVQDAYAKALAAWAAGGIPNNPGAWLVTVARRRALDLRRRAETARRSLPLLIDDQVEPGPGEDDPEIISDDRLRLIFTCCHPALSVEAQVALTLRLVCGLTTREVGRALMVGDSAMAARITRAKKKIGAAGIPYRVPGAEELPARVDAMLTVVHLMFSTGHTAPFGSEVIRRDLVEPSLRLARMLRTLLPDHADVTGLLALILLTDARSGARVSADGRIRLLEEQDRSRWDRQAIDEGISLMRRALRHRPPGRFTLMAAISAVHAEAPSWAGTDWREVLGLYDLLLRTWPSPVVAVNRAVAVGFAEGPETGLSALDALTPEPRLAGYHYLPAARADFLRRLGRTEEARKSYEQALRLTRNTVERDFLIERLRQLPNPRTDHP